MAWKPKEKELTREEAVALARRELAPYWIGSPPLLAAVGANALPLDDEFEKTSWLVCVADPTRFDGEESALLMSEFQRRYGSFGFNPLLILRAPYLPLRERAPAEAFIRKIRAGYPSCIDHDGKLSLAFHAGDLPRFLLLHSRRVVFHLDGDPFANKLEARVQSHLRSLDAGLSLPILLEPPSARMRDQDVFHASALPKGRVQLRGHWIQEAARIATSDPSASIALDAVGDNRQGQRALSIIAQSLSKSGEPARIELEAGGTVVFDVFGGPDLAFDEEGRSILRVVEARNYQPLRSLPMDRCAVTLKFPAADQVPIALYGIRIGAQQELKK